MYIKFLMLRSTVHVKSIFICGHKRIVINKIYCHQMLHNNKKREWNEFWRSISNACYCFSNKKRARNESKLNRVGMAVLGERRIKSTGWECQL